MDPIRYGPPQRFGAYNQMPPRPVMGRENGPRYRFPHPPVGPPPSHGPPPPEDEELRTMIDRLADHIAKSGPEKEGEMRRGHSGNPRFEFLFGGRHSDYYHYRLMMATRNMNGPPPSYKKPPLLPRSAAGPSGWNEPPVFDPQTAKNQIETLRKQVADSHSNLLAQYNSISQNKEEKVAAAVKQAEKDRIFAVLQQRALDIEPLCALLVKLNEGCGREVVQECKKWITQYCDSDNDQPAEVLLSYLLFRVKDDEASDAFKLNMLYVVHEWALSVQRQKVRMDNVKQSIARYIAQMYAFAAIDKSEQPSSLNDKLEKLVTIWEKSKTFDDSTIQQLRNPSQVKANYKLTLFNETQRVDRELTSRTIADYTLYEQQHKDFELHALTQIESLEKQIAQAENPNNSMNTNSAYSGDSYSNGSTPSAPVNPRRSRFDQVNPAEDSFRSFEPPPPSSWNGRPETNGGFFNPPVPMNPRPPMPMPLRDIVIPHTQPPPGVPFNNHDNNVPKTKHWILHTVGEMLTGIPDDALTYEPVNPDHVQVYTPGPLTPDISAEIERFYDTHIDPNNPRDADGWEQMGLRDYYTKKEVHRQRLLLRLERAGQTLEDAITNRCIPEEGTEGC